MQYLNIDKLESIDPDAFRATKPYPWSNPQGLITEDGYERLLANMPDLTLFDKKFGYERIAGQAPHDRYSLEYTPSTPAPKPWRDFIAELCGAPYREHMARLFGAKKINLRFHWHYTPNGCSVSPHTDSVREHGSQIFYFNSEQDWDHTWGGETLVLDDGGDMKFASAPTIEDFRGETAAASSGNHSMIFERTRHSWHAVREIQCPQDMLRKVFIVVTNPDNLYRSIRDKVMRKNVHRF